MSYSIKYEPIKRFRVGYVTTGIGTEPESAWVDAYRAIFYLDPEGKKRVINVDYMPADGTVIIASLNYNDHLTIETARLYADILKHAADLGESWRKGASFIPVPQHVFVEADDGKVYAVWECHGCAAVTFREFHHKQAEEVDYYIMPDAEYPEYAREMLIAALTAAPETIDFQLANTGYSHRIQQTGGLPDPLVTELLRRGIPQLWSNRHPQSAGYDHD